MLVYEPRLISGNLLVLEAAARDGLGAACLPRYLCRQALASGELIELFATESTWAAHAGQLYALLPNLRGKYARCETVRRICTASSWEFALSAFQDQTADVRHGRSMGRS